MLMAMVAILLVAPLNAGSESWMHIVGEVFVIQPKELQRMHGSLESQVTEVAKERKTSLPEQPRVLRPVMGDNLAGTRLTAGGVGPALGRPRVRGRAEPLKVDPSEP